MKRFLCAVALLALAGCDAFKDRTTVVEGRVFDEATGEPLEGIFLEMATSLGYGMSAHRDSTRTDSDGHYRLVYDGELQDPDLFVKINYGFFPDFGSKQSKSYAYAQASVKKYATKKQNFHLRPLK